MNSITRRLRVLTLLDPQEYLHGAWTSFLVAIAAILSTLVGFSIAFAMAFAVGCPGGETCPFTTARVILSGILIASLLLIVVSALVAIGAMARAMLLVARHFRRWS